MRLLAFIAGLWLLIGSLAGIILIPIFFYVAYGIWGSVLSVFGISFPLFFCLVYSSKN